MSANRGPRKRRRETPRLTEFLRIRRVVVCMENDKDNVLVTLTARRLAPSARIEQRLRSGRLSTSGGAAS